MRNETMMQFFEWYLPDNGLLWRRAEARAAALARAGITMAWLPPAYKGAAGARSVGYDVYDMYDLGEFDQKGTVRTKYGFRAEYISAIRALQDNGVLVLCDVVLNHRMGADDTESVVVEEEQADDRYHDLGGNQTIRAWTKFDFPGRAGAYSQFHWNASHFSGTDWDEQKRRNGIFRFAGKTWNRETDSENGNFDYLMGADLDTDNEEVVRETHDWGRWYIDAVRPDGFRLDAVKHISFDFYREWISDMGSYAAGIGKEDFFFVGEYWSPDVGKLTHYLDVAGHSLSLFDVPLHFHFRQAATSDGNYDMSRLFDGTLTGADPGHSVPFVDNHDTQPGQALESFIPAWFKPIAYAIILLRNAGVPCVFYGDYYGIAHDGIAPVPCLGILLRIRALYAYGQEHLFFDDPSIVGFTREGDAEHEDSGVAVLVSDSAGGSKRMYAGQRLAGARLADALGRRRDTVAIGADGWGTFTVDGGSVSVWLVEKAAGELFIAADL